MSGVRTEDDTQKNEGVKGRMAVLKEQRQEEQQGASETVGHAKPERCDRMSAKSARVWLFGASATRKSDVVVGFQEGSSVK